MNTRVQTGYPLDNHRTTPISAFSQFAGAVHDSPNIDFMWLWDELSGWFPGELWTPANTPAAEFIDGNSTYDPFLQAAIALAHNPDANVRLSTDAIRSAPAELLRKVLTLSNATSGDVVLAVGAGELRQTKPFGYKRTEGLKRLEDIFQLVRRLYDEPEPWTQETNFWHLKNATIGNHRPEKRPEFWALGGGPVLLDIAARYADGFEAATPQAIQTPEEFSETVKDMRQKVESYDRDPDEFGFGIWSLYVCHEDPEVIEKVLANPIVRYFAGQFGRLDQTRWIEEGETPVMPDGWHYAVKWAPFEQTDEEINRIVNATPQSMSRKAYHVGTPRELTKLHTEYVEAGAQFVGWLDMTPLALGPLEGPESLRRANEISGLIKQAAGVGGVTATQVQHPAHLSDVDEVLHTIPDVDLWVENYLSQAYFPDEQIGAFLHLGRVSFDQPAWDELVLVYLPGDKFLTARSFCYGGETPQGPAGPCLTYQCVEPWRKWRKTFRGPARLVSGDELRSGGVADGLHVKLSFDLVYEAMCPVFELGEMREQNWASWHYEQHCTVTGTLSYGDVSVTLNGSGIRDHSTGARDLTGLHNHIWCHAEWPDGRAFCLMYLGNQDGTGRMNHAAVCTGDSVRYGRLVSAAPLLDSWDQRGNDYTLTLDVEGETIELTATIEQVGALTVAGPGEVVRGAARGEGCHHLLSEAMTRFTWNGLDGFGLSERSVLMK